MAEGGRESWEGSVINITLSFKIGIIFEWRQWREHYDFLNRWLRFANGVSHIELLLIQIYFGPWLVLLIFSFSFVHHWNCSFCSLNAGLFVSQYICVHVDIHIAYTLSTCRLFKWLSRKRYVHSSVFFFHFVSSDRIVRRIKLTDLMELLIYIYTQWSEFFV